MSKIKLDTLTVVARKSWSSNPDLLPATRESGKANEGTSGDDDEED